MFLVLIRMDRTSSFAAVSGFRLSIVTSPILIIVVFVVELVTVH